MNISKRGFIAIAVCAVAASLFAGPHHRHGRPLPPNAYWCHKCGGDGYNWTWYGWRKTCGICDGRGWCVKHVAPPPVRIAPPPPRKVAPPPRKVAPPPPRRDAPQHQRRDRRDVRDNRGGPRR